MRSRARGRGADLQPGHGHPAADKFVIQRQDAGPGPRGRVDQQHAQRPLRLPGKRGHRRRAHPLVRQAQVPPGGGGQRPQPGGGQLAAQRGEPLPPGQEEYRRALAHLPHRVARRAVGRDGAPPLPRPAQPGGQRREGGDARRHLPLPRPSIQQRRRAAVKARVPAEHGAGGRRPRQGAEHLLRRPGRGPPGGDKFGQRRQQPCRPGDDVRYLQRPPGLAGQVGRRPGARADERQFHSHSSHLVSSWGRVSPLSSAGRAMTTGHTPSARAAASFWGRPPARPPSLVTR